MRLTRIALPALALASAACTDAPTAVPTPALAAGTSLAPASGWVVSTIPAPGGLPNATAWDVDDAGRVVVTAWNESPDDGSSRAFVVAGGVATPLPPLDPAHPATTAFASSASGRIVAGHVTDASGAVRQVRWTDGGTPTAYAAAPGSASYFDISAVNDAGQALGASGRWEADGSFTPIGEPNTFPFGMNGAGVSVGLRFGNCGMEPFRWTRDGAVQPFTQPVATSCGAPSGLAFDVNDLGAVVGQADWIVDAATGATSAWATLWQPDGKPQKLFALPGGAQVTGMHLNSRDIVIGGYYAADSGTPDSFVWEPGASTFTPLPLPSWAQPGTAFAANLDDAGVIVGYASDGTHTHALRWTPATPNAAPVIKTLKLDPAVLNRPKAGQPFPLTFVWSDAADAGPWAWTMSWGDGTTSSGTLATQSQLDVSHRYATPGSKTATLTISDPLGASASKSIPVSVQ